MALTSSSTLADATAQLQDNLAWDGNATKIANALEAVRWLLFFRLNNAADGDGQSYTYEQLKDIEDRLTKAQRQAAVADTVSGKRVTRTYAEF